MDYLKTKQITIKPIDPILIDLFLFRCVYLYYLYYLYFYDKKNTITNILYPKKLKNFKYLLLFTF